MITKEEALARIKSFQGLANIFLERDDVTHPEIFAGDFFSFKYDITLTDGM